MKIIVSLLLLIGPGWYIGAIAQHKHKKKPATTKVIIQLNNSVNNNTPVDSVYIIFDRHNLTEAGAIKKIFYPVNNKVIIEDVPEGKFYITLICLGIYHDSFTEISYVYEKRKNKNKFRFRLQPADTYNASNIYIPEEKIDISNLSIFRKKIMK